MARLLFAFSLALLVTGCPAPTPADMEVQRDLTAKPPDLTPGPDLAPAADLAVPVSDLASPSDGGAEARCVAAGGTVTMQLCCQATNDFPNLCTVGPCGCAPMNSHMVKVCRCLESKCWNGTTCADRQL